jgi:glycosyltransferase involved in cell wall biosynthesis
MLTLVPGVSGGSETYARGLARGLARRGVVDAVAVVPTLAQDAGEGLPSHVLTAYPASTSTPGRLAAMARAGILPGRLRDAFDAFDVVHYPLTVPVPRARRAREAITLHDVQHRDLPELFPFGERLFRRLAYDRAAKHADAVIVPSTFVRDRARSILGLRPDSVHVIHFGVDERYSLAPVPREPFLLYPARPWAHKNHAVLLEAFRLLRRHRPELRLVLTGVGSERFGEVEGVDARGRVSADELVSLYRRAECLVFPSRYEGFGAPPLEAMACGTPVAASSAGSLPEVCGDAAVLFGPERPELIASGVLEALDRAKELSARGLERARTFTWEATAAAHEKIYELLLG